MRAPRGIKASGGAWLNLSAIMTSDAGAHAALALILQKRFTTDEGTQLIYNNNEP